MINFREVFSNTLWVVGLATVLAVLSYARYTAQVHRVRVRDKLDTLNYALVLNGGLFLFLCGMALTERRLFARLLWILLGISVIVYSTMLIKLHRADKVEPSMPSDDNSG